MAVDNSDALWGETTSPELILARSTALSKMSFDTRFDESVFSRSAFDTSDVHENANASIKNERWQAGLKGTFDYDTTRTSELSNYSLQPVLSRHTGLSVAPQITFTPTQLDALSIAGSFVSSRYTKYDLFTDYETFTVSPSYKRMLDPNNAGILSMQAQRYQTTRNNETQVDSLSSSLGWQYALSQRYTANASAGAQATRQYSWGAVTGPWTWEYIFSGGFSFHGLTDTLDVSASRQQFPYGDGTEALQTSVSVNESHNLSPTVSLNVGASYLTSHYQTAANGNLKTMTDGHLGAAYHMTPTMDLTMDYRYRYETLVNRSQSAKSNIATIGFVYKPCLWTF